MTLINPENSFTLLAVVVAIVAVGLMAENTKLGKKLSASLVIIFSSALLSNLGVIPDSAPIYNNIQAFLIPMAIPLLLFRANITKIFKESGTMLFSFCLAIFCTITGAVIASYLVDLGELEHAIVGALTASYIGGSANFVATSEALKFTDSSLYISALAADAIGAVLFLILLMSLPVIAFIRKSLPSRFIDNVTDAAPILPSEGSGVTTPIKVEGVIYGLTLSVLICVIGNKISSFIPVTGVFIMVITILSLLAANFGQIIINKIQFDFELGTIFMYLFFATIGASANLTNVLESALPIILFLLILIAIHILLLLLFGRWFKLDLAELMIASSACILGPAAAAALATGQGWKSLVSSGILVGILGYAIATFIGIALSGILS